MNDHLSPHSPAKDIPSTTSPNRRVAFNISMTRTQIRTFTLFIRGQEVYPLINKGSASPNRRRHLYPRRGRPRNHAEEAGLISKTTAPVEGAA
jgi:hypothetical protein